MKIDKNKKIRLIKKNETPTEQKKQKTAQEYRGIDEQILRDAESAAYSQGLAILLMQGPPSFIAEEIEKEFYEDKCNEIKQSKNNNSNIYDFIEQHFRGEECYELMNTDGIDDYPEILKKIIEAKNKKDKTPRFNAEQCQKLFEIAPQIKKFSNIFDSILSAQKDDESPRFNCEQIDKIMTVADMQFSSNENFVNTVTSIRDKKGKLFFTGDECVRLLSNPSIGSTEYIYLQKLASKIDSQKSKPSLESLIKKAKEQISIDKENKNLTSRRDLPARNSKDAHVIAVKNDFYQKIAEASELLDGEITIGDKTFSAQKLLAEVDRDPKSFLLIMSNGDNGQPRFNETEKAFLFEKIKTLGTRRAPFESFMNLKNTKGEYLLNALECLGCVNNIHGPEIFELSANVIDDKTGEPRFSKAFCYGQIKELNSNTEVKDPKLFVEILKIRNKDGSFKFDIKQAHTLDSVSEQINQYPEIFKMLYQLKSSKGNYGRFEAYEIAALMRVADKIKQYPKLFKELLSIDLHSGYTCGETEDNDGISCLMKEAEKVIENKDFFNKLVEYKEENKARFNGQDCAQIIKNIDTIKTMPEFFDKLLTHKSHRGYTLNAKQCIDLLGSKKDIEDNPKEFEELVENWNINIYSLCDAMKENRNLLTTLKEKPKIYKDLICGKHSLYSVLKLLRNTSSKRHVKKY